MHWRMRSNRREFIGELTAMGGMMLIPPNLGLTPAAVTGDTDTPKMYELPDLPYRYAALDPVIDEKTLTIHHTKHHAGYTRGLNKVLAQMRKTAEAGDFSNISQLTRLLAFHGAGYVNHTQFWHNMAPSDKGGGGAPSGKLAAKINADFGSLKAFRDCFATASKKVMGSGWGLLGYHPELKRLLVLSVGNHENALLPGIVPLLILDVWEHAYYIKYQNRRSDFVDAWWNIVNWKDVEKRFAAHPAR